MKHINRAQHDGHRYNKLTHEEKLSILDELSLFLESLGNTDHPHFSSSLHVQFREEFKDDVRKLLKDFATKSRYGDDGKAYKKIVERFSGLKHFYQVEPEDKSDKLTGPEQTKQSVAKLPKDLPNVSRIKQKLSPILGCDIANFDEGIDKPVDEGIDNYTHTNPIKRVLRKLIGRFLDKQDKSLKDLSAIMQHINRAQHNGNPFSRLIHQEKLSILDALSVFLESLGDHKGFLSNVKTHIITDHECLLNNVKDSDEKHKRFVKNVENRGITWGDYDHVYKDGHHHFSSSLHVQFRKKFKDDVRKLLKDFATELGQTGDEQRYKQIVEPFSGLKHF